MGLERHSGHVLAVLGNGVPRGSGLIFSGGGTAFSPSSLCVFPPLENSEEYHHSKNLKKKMDMGSSTLRNSMTLLNTVDTAPKGFLSSEKGCCVDPAALS